MLLRKKSLFVKLAERVLSSTFFKYNVTTMLSVCQHSRGLFSNSFVSQFYFLLCAVISWLSICHVESADPCLSGPAFSLLECLGRMEADTQDIDLRGRGITYIPDGAFQKFTNLNLLDLSFNRIRTVSSEAFDVTEVRTLKLNDNLIETLSGPITAWQTFFHSKPDAVSLGNNRLTCNCSITWLVEFLVTDEFIQDAALVRCTEPAEWQNLPLRSMPETVDAACKGAVMGTSLGARYCNSPTMFPCSTPPTGTPSYPCIEQALLCDGMAHCPLTGNDENPFICNGYRRGVPKIPNDMVPFVKDSFGYFESLLERARSQMGFATAVAPTKAVPEVSGCRKGLFKCFSGALCIPSVKMCDGSPDCPDGADEEISMCIKATVSPYLRPTFPPEPTAQILSTGPANRTSVTFHKLNESRDNLTIATVGLLAKAFFTASQTTRTPASTTDVPATSLMTTTSIEDGLIANLDVQRLPVAYLPVEQISSLPVLATDMLAPHPTITFPQVNGVAHVNHFQNNFAQDIVNYYDGELVSVKEKVSTTEVAPTVLEGVVNVSSVSTEMVRLPAESFLQPVRIHIKSSANHDLVIGWDPPGSPQGNGWHLVAYSVECDILRNGSNKKKKKSPLLSTLVREYVFHHILPEDSLKLTVKALYQDTDNQRYEYTSETFLREGTDGLPVYQNPEKEVALPSAKQVNYPGKMGFEDVLGIAVGGTLAGLMVLLIGIYLFRKKNMFLKRGGHGTNARALRMRKIDSRHHQKVNDRTLSTEPIYSEPEYALQTALDNGVSISRRLQTLRSPPLALGQPVNPEDGYVQVLESESPYYNPARSRSCSEYSCYSVSAGINPALANSRLVPASLPSSLSDSSYGSFAVYDSDNCSVGYYYHNSGLAPTTATGATTATQCLHAQNLKHFGDTLTPCHNVPVSHTLTLPITTTRNGRSAHEGKSETIGKA